MGFCTSLFLPNGIETEVLPASITELKGVFIQNRIADFTVLDLHRLKKVRVRGVKEPWVQEPFLLKISLRVSVIPS